MTIVRPPTLRRRSSVSSLMVLAALAVATVGCGGGSEDAGPATTGATTVTTGGATTGRPSTTAAPTTTGRPTTTVAPSTTTTIEGPPFLAATAVAQRQFPGTNALAVLTDVRIGRHTGYDRVVFQFRDNDALPGYLVDYRPLPVTADPSDLPLTVTGDHALVVRMQAASRFDFDNGLTQVYTGPNTVTGSAAAVTEVVLRGDFEAMLSWVIGLRGARPFRVTTLTGPPRIVVDVATGS